MPGIMKKSNLQMDLCFLMVKGMSPFFMSTCLRFNSSTVEINSIQCQMVSNNPLSQKNFD